MTIVTQLSLFDNLEPKPKRCSKCGEYFPCTEEFWHKDKSSKNGFTDRCKQCRKRPHKEYVKRHYIRPEYKTCPKCNETYPLTPEFWHRNRASYDGASSWCKQCRTAPKKEYVKPDFKTCLQCGETYLLIEEFWHKDQTSKDRFSSYCKQCSCDKAREWYRENPDRAKANVIKWRNNNPTRVKIIIRKYERKNYDKIYSTKKLYRSKNRIRYCAVQHKRRVQKLANGGSYTKKEIEALYENQDQRCYHCGKFISLKNSKTCHVDHWIPISKGGTNYIENIKLLCPYCNLTKNNKLPCEWDNRYCE